jgi:2-polyprenyl-3-methyl-5-hydroxy-6-metoxy-1,4-benzoquinol methylase
MTTHCSICAADARFSYSVDGYDFFECSSDSCTHVFISPVPTEAELLKVYTADRASIANSDSWTQVRDYETNPQAVRDYNFKTRINWLIENGALPSKDAAVLDVGCAVGMLLRTLKDAGYTKVHGMDLSPLHCEYVRDAHGIPCETSLDDVPDGAFDVVYCCGVLEHTPDPVKFCQVMSNKLKPGGQMVIGVPNYDADYRKLSGKSWVWLIPPIHLQYFSDRSLQRTMQNAGLVTVIRDSWYNGTYVYLLAHHLTYALGLSMPSTQRTGRPAIISVVNLVESTLRAMLYPWALLARKRMKHNELNFIASKGGVSN